MIRIVLDTNVFISALLQPNGLPAHILTVALGGERVRLCISAEIYSEYEEVIRRPRFRRSEPEIADALRAVREQGLWFKPLQEVRACSDPTTCFLSARKLPRLTFS
jgi:putative PIN family toxin of toxin-antitoxin system